MYDEMNNVNNVLEVQEYVPENLDSLSGFEPPPSPPERCVFCFPAEQLPRHAPAACASVLRCVLVCTLSKASPEARSGFHCAAASGTCWTDSPAVLTQLWLARVDCRGLCIAAATAAAHLWLIAALRAASRVMLAISGFVCLL